MKISKWCLGMGVALASASVSHAGEEGVQVAIGGMPGTEFSASWSLAPANGGPVRDGHWSGVVPQEYHLPSGRLDLSLTQISATGHLEVTVTAGGNRSRSRTQGQGSRLQLVVQ